MTMSYTAICICVLLVYPSHTPRTTTTTEPRPLDSSAPFPLTDFQSLPNASKTPLFLCKISPTDAQSTGPHFNNGSGARGSVAMADFHFLQLGQKFFCAEKNGAFTSACKSSSDWTALLLGTRAIRVCNNDRKVGVENGACAVQGWSRELLTCYHGSYFHYHASRFSYFSITVVSKN